MTFRRVWVWVGVGVALFASGADAQAPPTSVDPTLVVAVADNETVLDPLGPPRHYEIVSTVTCGVKQADNPSYVLHFQPVGKAAEMTVGFDADSAVTFTTQDCLGAQGGNTQTVRTNVSVSMPRTADAFSRTPLTINGTLKRGTDELAWGEDKLNVTVGYVAGLTLEASASSKKLAANRAIFEVTLHNFANGPTQVAGTVLNRSAGLTVTIPDPLTLSRGASQVAGVDVLAVPGCAEPVRSILTEWIGKSPDPRGRGNVNHTLSLTVHCSRPEKGLPTLEVPAVALITMAVAGRLSRQWGLR